MAGEQYPKATGAGDEFAATRWSVVLLAGQSHSPASATALEELCRAYWYPLYAFVRRTGRSEHEAQDLTQEFFCRLLEKQMLRSADPGRGKFRSFLISAMKNFLANDWNRVHAQKRGGRQPHFSLDTATAEERYQVEPAHTDTPEKIYERRWAQAVLEQVMARLRADFDTGGKSQRFDELRPLLVDEHAASSYAEVGSRIGMSEQAVKSAVHRLRRRFRELFREEIAATVADPSEVDAELRDLIATLSS